jgi:hypothetical protein
MQNIIILMTVLNNTKWITPDLLPAPLNAIIPTLVAVEQGAQMAQNAEIGAVVQNLPNERWAAGQPRAPYG